MSKKQKKPKPTLREEFERDRKIFTHALEYLNSDDDRIVAIMGCCFVESCLERVLRSGFILCPSQGLLDSLFQFGAFQSIQVRADFARAKGLLTKESREDISDIQWIRNQFAHYILLPDSDEPLTFTTSVIAKRCDKLKLAERGLPESVQLSEGVVLDLKDPKHRYICAVLTIGDGLLCYELIENNDAHLLQADPGKVKQADK